MTKQLRDNVFELFHGPEKDIPETPLDVARPVAASLPVAAAGSAVDLTGKPKIIMLMGAGRSGKSSLARLIVERALNREEPPELVLATADAQRPTLKRFFADTMLPQSAGGATQFLMTLLSRLVETRRTAVIDLGADMTMAPILAQIPDFLQIMIDSEISPVLLYMLTPRSSDLTVLKTMEIMEFMPTATALIPNLGTTTSEDPVGEFGQVRKHSAYRAAMARGAVEVFMPKLWSARVIEDRGLGFYQATNGPHLGLVDRRRLSSWLTDMDRALAAISSWLP